MREAILTELQAELSWDTDSIVGVVDSFERIAEAIKNPTETITLSRNDAVVALYFFGMVIGIKLESTSDLGPA